MPHEPALLGSVRTTRNDKRGTSYKTVKPGNNSRIPQAHPGYAAKEPLQIHCWVRAVC